MPRKKSVRHIKKNSCYTYEEAAKLLKLTPQTVRQWRREGLVVLDDQIPHLILGEALIEFLSKNKMRSIGKLGQEQFYCLSCKSPTTALGDMADYVPIDDDKGRLVALCRSCEVQINKFISPKLLSDLDRILSIVIKHGSRH